MPVKGRKYLIFIETAGKALRITKVMPDTKGGSSSAVSNEGD